MGSLIGKEVEKFMHREVLDGQHFGEWMVLEYAGNKKQLCRCSCGEIREIATYSLTSGKSQNCGSKSKHLVEGEKKFKDLRGKVFGELTALEYLGDTYWKCICAKGHEVSKSWKHLTTDSKCEICKAESLKAKRLSIDDALAPKKPSIAEQTVGLKVNDLAVIKNLGDDRFLCRCKCGKEVEVRGYRLRHPPSATSYTCRHKISINDTFGDLTVIYRFPNGICRCQCKCGNIKDVMIGNLLNGSTKSCGCMVKPTHSKEEVLALINGFIEENKVKPFTSELSELLYLGMTATYEYIERYELAPYLNTSYGSRAEKDIAELLKTKYKIILHSRKLMSDTKELDIYIPEKKIAIEFNGTYWHQYPFKDKTYHQKKSLECANKEIQLIHIFEYEWNSPALRPKIESLLNGILGNHKIVYARDLKIVEVGNKEAKKFEDENHLQGGANSTINIALATNDGEILGLMTFGAPRFSHSYEYELIRLCYKLNTNIVGGSERMFKYFLNRYLPTSILSYCNIAKFTGRVYNTLGFKLSTTEPITEPNYIWTNPKTGRILTRYNTMKKNLVAQGYGDESQSEDEIMMSHGYYKLYDSGNLRFEYSGIRSEG